jgi:hypothetical protein
VVLILGEFLCTSLFCTLFDKGAILFGPLLHRKFLLLGTLFDLIFGKLQAWASTRELSFLDGHVVYIQE